MTKRTRRIARCTMPACIGRYHIPRLRGRGEDGTDSHAVINSEQSRQRLSWACVAATQGGRECVVEGDCVGGRRGKGVGDADGEVLVPFSGVFVAEEVKMVGVKVPGHGHIEVDAASLVEMLAMMELEVAREWHTYNLVGKRCHVFDVAWSDVVEVGDWLFCLLAVDRDSQGHECDADI